MGGRDDRMAEPCALADGAASAAEPAGSGPGAAAEVQGSGSGLVDALHGAPALPAAIADAMPGGRSSTALRLVSKACREAVDAAATRITLSFGPARQQQPGANGGASLVERMERRLAELPCLLELACSEPSIAELRQLLAGPVAAGVRRLVVRGCTSGRPAHLPTLEVCWSPPCTLTPCALPRGTVVACAWPRGAPTSVPGGGQRTTSEGTAFTVRSPAAPSPCRSHRGGYSRWPSAVGRSPSRTGGEGLPRC
jgi:hypothetical protein